ncbi:hypothetical protein AX16_008512 [Volvariella volvacea WC 439]|nr:hypothetical protein AX16_008512 [Volvariella volvacea WC 439]
MLLSTVTSTVLLALSLAFHLQQLPILQFLFFEGLALWAIFSAISKKRLDAMESERRGTLRGSEAEAGRLGNIDNDATENGAPQIPLTPRPRKPTSDSTTSTSATLVSSYVGQNDSSSLELLYERLTVLTGGFSLRESVPVPKSSKESFCDNEPVEVLLQDPDPFASLPTTVTREHTFNAILHDA